MKVLISTDGAAPRLGPAIQAANYHVTEVVTCGDTGGCVSIFAKKMGVPVKNMGPKEATQYAQALVAIWDGKSITTKRLIDEARSKRLLVYIYRLEEV